MSNLSLLLRTYFFFRPNRRKRRYFCLKFLQDVVGDMGVQHIMTWLQNPLTCLNQRAVVSRIHSLIGTTRPIRVL